MAVDTITVWNMALAAVGSTSTVSSVNERSREANLCRLWYDLVRDNVLKAAPWPSAMTSRRLALVAERGNFKAPWTNVHPAPGFAYAYSLPENLLAPRWLETRANFTLTWSEGLIDNILSTNIPKAILTYTFNQQLEAKWDAGLLASVVDTLAATITQGLSGKTTLARELRQNALERILVTQTAAANERQVQYKHIPTAALVRGYDNPTGEAEYIYPFETLSVGAV